MPTYFQGNDKHPQHISVGAILINDKGEVCCHHLFAKDVKGYWKEEGLDDFYILMRETLEPGESLEHAVQRGLMEEFGAVAEIIDYVGSIKSSFRDNVDTTTEIEKTTLYFVCRLIDQDLLRRSGDVESTTAIEWQMSDYLIPLMKEQTKRFGRTDADESSILERVKTAGYTSAI